MRIGSPLKVFFLEPTELVEESLRRYNSSGSCSVHGYHDAEVIIAQRASTGEREAYGDLFDHADPRWPARCECGYEFTETDQWQYRPTPLYKHSGTGALTTLRRSPVGSMWLAPWMSDDDSGHLDHLFVRVPGLSGHHDWYVDGRASNCDSPCAHCGVPYHAHKGGPDTACPNYYTDARPHKCWVRHGDPKTGDVHVDKSGVTCGAGGGSIFTDSMKGWHGFLHTGFLRDC